MAVLLEGINIPKGNPITINIYRDGTWVNAYTTEDGNAIEIPEPHGRLIDADAFVEKCEEMADKEDGNQLDALVLLRWFLEQNAPTVIPAGEEGET